MNAAFKEQEEATAYHEAGHAVIGCVLGYLPKRVSIVPVGGAVGMAHFDENYFPKHLESAFSQSPEKPCRIKAMVVTMLSGSLAQSIKFPDRHRDLADKMDEQKARNLVMDLPWQDIDAYVADARNKASELLKEHWSWVEAVATALIQRKELTGDEVLALRP